MAALTSSPASSPPRLLAFISGGGRTVLHLLDEIRAGRLHARIAGVIASRPCPGVERARARGLDVRIVPGVIPAAELERLFAEFRADRGVLAGYLQRIDLPPSLRGRLLNIHPALLPKFGGPGMFGMRVHRAVLAAGERESGCTVHVVDDGYDTGPVVLQRRCPVLPGDTPDSLAARVFEEEKIAYPDALRRVLTPHA